MRHLSPRIARPDRIARPRPFSQLHDNARTTQRTMAANANVKDLIARFGGAKAAAARRRASLQTPATATATTTTGAAGTPASMATTATPPPPAAAPPTMRTAPAPTPTMCGSIPLHGISLEHLQTLIATSNAEEDIPTFARRVAAAAAAANANDSVASVVARTTPTAYAPQANLFVSCPRTTTMSDVVSSLSTGEYPASTTFVFMDALCVPASKPISTSDKDLADLATALQRIGRVALVVSPWSNAELRQRAWCVWEAATALRTKTPRVAVLPRRERDAFERLVRENKLGPAAEEAFAPLSLQMAASGGGGDDARRLLSNLASHGTTDDEINDAFTAPLEVALVHLAEAVVNANAKDTLPHAHACASLDDIHTALSDYEKALYWSRRALDAFKAARAPDERVATQMNNVATVLSELDRNEEAMDMHHAALEIKRRVLPNHPSTATTLNNLALCLMDEERWGEAVEPLREALAIRKSVLGARTLPVAEVLNNLGTLQTERRELDEALAAHDEALSIRREALGASHRLVAQSLNNRAEALKSAERFEEALDTHEEALRMRRNVLGPDHPDVFQSENNVGMVLMELERFDEALDKLQSAVRGWKSSLGPSHPQVATGLNNVGMCLTRMGRAQDAVDVHNEAVAITKQALGEDHADVAVLLANSVTVGEVARGRASLAPTPSRANSLKPVVAA